MTTLWRCPKCRYERSFDDCIDRIDCPMHPINKHFAMRRIQAIEDPSLFDVVFEPIDDVDPGDVL